MGKHLVRFVLLFGDFRHIHFGGSKKLYEGFYFKPLKTPRYLCYKIICGIHKRLAGKNIVCSGFDGPCFNRGVVQQHNLCNGCAKLNDEFWSELWKEHNSF